MADSGEDRQPGLHLSDITGRLAYEKDRKLNPDTPMDRQVIDKGFTWETVLERALSARQLRSKHETGYRPKQIQEDGIWLSPDWVNPSQAGVQHEEWKATKKSSKHDFEEKHWHWLPNTMAYLRALLKQGSARDPVTRFRVWFINGDYTYQAKSSDFHLLQDYWRFDIAFEKRELENNWRAILAAGRRFGLIKGEPWGTKQTPQLSPKSHVGHRPLNPSSTRPASTLRPTKRS
jgi:hypothetical protein